MSKAKRTPGDISFLECADQMEKLAAQGMYCFQKVSCAKCGTRLTIDRPNVMHKTVSCDTCGYVTNAVEVGCGYALVATNNPDALLGTLERARREQ